MPITVTEAPYSNGDLLFLQESIVDEEGQAEVTFYAPEGSVEETDVSVVQTKHQAMIARTISEDAGPYVDQKMAAWIKGNSGGKVEKKKV